MLVCVGFGFVCVLTDGTRKKKSIFMNAFALLPFFSFSLCVFLGSAAIFKGTANRISVSFAFYYFAFAYYFLISFGYLQSDNFEQASLWWKLDFLWPIVYVVPVVIMIAITGFSNRFFSGLVFVFLFVPTIFFILTEIFFNTFTGPPIKQEWGWFYGQPSSDIAGSIIFIWSVVTTMFSVYLGINYLVRAKPAENRQSVIVMFFIFLMPIIIQGIQSFFPFNVKLFPIFLIMGSIVVVISAFVLFKLRLLDITPAFAAESILTTISDAVFLISRDKKIIRVNRSAEMLIGLSESDLRQHTLDDYFDVSDQVHLFCDPPQSKSQAVGPKKLEQIETEIQPQRDKKIIVSFSASQLLSETKKLLGVVAVVRDITARKKAEKELEEYRDKLEVLVESRTNDLEKANMELVESKEQLRLLGERILAAKEEESARIAHELHDELGQILTGMKIDMSLLARSVQNLDQQKMERLTQRIETLVQLCDIAIDSVRKVTRGLRPKMLDDIGLVGTIEWLAGEFEKRTEIRNLPDHKH